MSKLAHVWFDVDNTLYFMPPEMEAEIFKRVYEKVQELKGWGEKHTHKTYNEAYAFKKSHSDAFNRLGLPVNVSRETYGSVKLEDFWKKGSDKKPVSDKKLLSLLDSLDQNEVPFSFYTNNFLHAVLQTFDVLGVKFERFARHVTGDAHNKALGTKGYDQVLELSTLEYQKRTGTSEVLDPSRILYVGDREDLDIKPAKSKGMLAALVVWPDGKNEEERAAQMDAIKTSADFKIPDVYSLAEIVEQLTRP